MKTYARIQDGKVVEIIEPLVIDDREIPIKERFHPDFVNTLVEITTHPEVKEGWSYQDAIFSQPSKPAPEVPKRVTMRQARLALLQAGKLKAVNDAVVAMPGVEGDAARIEWEFSSEVWRDKQLVKSLAPVLNLTEPELDQLFITAATL